ncbi:MAG: tripartite tricarboxylate transporter substrate-binding protein [Desulfobacterales bacterium]|nr:tripartite tricarboxylate transporter substrate-binding protein [Desulfobacterales bacterium]
MQSSDCRWIHGIFMLALVLGLTAGSPPVARAENPEQFYKGKTIDWVVSSGRAGDTTDFITRIISPYLAEFTGANVKVENMGSSKGINHVYTKTKPDGLTLVTKATTAAMANYVLKAPGVRYDIEKYSYIADVLPDFGAFVLSPKSKYKNIEELRKATGLKAGATTVKGRGATGAAVMFEILGLNGKVITGYQGKKGATLALARGEVDTSFGSDATAVELMKSGNGVPLFIAADQRSALLPDLPTLAELGVKIPAHLEDAFNFVGVSGKMVAATPGTPADRIAYLRGIFQKISQIKKFQDEVKNWAGAWLGFIPGEKLHQYMIKMKSNKDLAKQIDDIMVKYTAVK